MGNRLTYGLGGRGHCVDMLGGDEGEVNVLVAFQFRLRWRAIRLSLTNTRQNGIDDYGQTCLLHHQAGGTDG